MVGVGIVAAVARAVRAVHGLQGVNVPAHGGGRQSIDVALGQRDARPGVVAHDALKQAVALSVQGAGAHGAGAVRVFQAEAVAQFMEHDVAAQGTGGEAGVGAGAQLGVEPDVTALFGVVGGVGIPELTGVHPMGGVADPDGAVPAGVVGHFLQDQPGHSGPLGQGGPDGLLFVGGAQGDEALIGLAAGPVAGPVAAVAGDAVGDGGGGAAPGGGFP